MKKVKYTKELLEEKVKEKNFCLNLSALARNPHVEVP